MKLQVVALVVTLVAVTSGGPTLPRNFKRCAGYCKATGTILLGIRIPQQIPTRMVAVVTEIDRKLLKQLREKYASKFKYEPGMTYVYNYAADSITTITGTTNEESRLHLRATAEFQVLSQCDFSLKLRDVTLEDSDPGDAQRKSSVDRVSEFSKALQKNPLHFSFQDGKVEELCPSTNDPAWVLNIKRGILSTFQNTMKDLENSQKVYETDVTGTCETEYVVENKGWTTLTIKKSKDLLACSNRQDHFFSFQSTPYRTSSKLQSLPLIRSKHQCTQTISTERIEQVVCVESHLFQPFSNHESGATTKTTQNLIYYSEYQTEEVAKDYASSRSTLLYDHTSSSNVETTKEEEVINTLNLLNQKTQNGIEKDVPKLFSQLVYSLRGLNYQQLTTVFESVKDKHTRKFLLDAMPLIGTAEGMATMRDLFHNGEIKMKEMDKWLTSLAFQKDPTLNMISAVSSLLQDNPRSQAILGISAMVHNYCKKNTNCESNPEVEEILYNLEKLLGRSCQASSEEQKQQIILALKGIGNLGVKSRATDVLTRCYQDESNSMDIRLAAIEAFRRLPCGEIDRGHLFTTYENSKEDTEIRIASYLAVMRCPTVTTLDKIKKVLYNEEVNQVGSFVWTHLTNLQETGSQTKQRVKELLHNDFLRNKFNTDARKFSRNYEGSLYSDALNAGVTAESNLIFSTKSYLPRSAMLNLTLDLFGESINLLEVGGRVEGFEGFVESLFGPDGYFPDDSINKLLHNARNQNDDANSINQLGETFDVQSTFTEEPQGSLYLRMFGNELHYTHFQGLDNLIEKTGFGNPIDMLLKIAHEQDIDYTNSFVFLDGSYIIPTSIGFPLTLTVNGGATVGFKMGGKMNTKEFFNQNILDIEGHIMPSAAVEIKTVMSVDAFVAKNGLKMVSLLHTNTYLDGKIKMRGKDLIEMKLNMPREKMEIVDVSSELFILHREEEYKIAAIQEDYETSQGCTSPAFSRSIGIEVCEELKYPNASLVSEAPYFPLTGPASYKLQLLKTDTFSAYELQYKWQVEGVSDKSIQTITFGFDTPGSQTDRKVKALFILDETIPSLKVNIITPFKKIQANAKYEYTDSEKSCDVTFIVDDHQVFGFKGEVRNIHNGKTGRFEPSLTMTLYQQPLVDLRGSVNYVKGLKYSTDLTLTGLTETPIKISGDINRDGNKYDISANVKSYVVDGLLQGTIRSAKNYFTSKATLQYSIQQGPHQSLDLSVKYQNTNKGALYRHNSFFTLTSSQYPDYNLKTSWDMQVSDGYYDGSGMLQVGSTKWETQQKYSNQQSNDEKEEFIFKFTLVCPAKDVDYLLEVEHQVTPVSLSNHIQAHLSKEREFLSDIQYVHRTDPVTETLSIDVKYPKRELKLHAEVNEVEPKKYDLKLSAQWSHDKVVRMGGTYFDRSNQVFVDHSMNVDAEIPGYEPMKFSGDVTAAHQTSAVKTKLMIGDTSYITNIHYTKGDKHELEGDIVLGNQKYNGKITLLNDRNEKGLSLDLNLKKHIVLDTKLKFNDKEEEIEFQLFWDRDMDVTKKVYFRGMCSDEKLEVMLQYPGKTVQGGVTYLSNGITAELEWDPIKKISFSSSWDVGEHEGSIRAKLTTPFAGLESQSLSAVCKVAGYQVEAEINAAWQQETAAFKFSGSSEGENTKAHVFIRTTIPGYRSISFDLEHSHTDSQLNTYAVADWDGEEVTLDSNWFSNTKQTMDLKGTISFTTPTLRVNGNIVHTQGRDGISSSGELAWSEYQKISYSFNSKVEDTSANALLTITTPFSDYRLFSLDAKYKYDEYTSFGGATAIFNSKTAAIEVQRSNKQSSTMETVAKILLPGMDELKVILTFNAPRDPLNKNVKVLSGNNVIVNFNIQGSTNIRNLNIETSLHIPGHTMGAKVQNILEKSNVNSHIEGTWNEEKTELTMLGKYEKSRTHHLLEYSLEASSSVFTSGEFKMHLKHWKNKNTYDTEFEVTDLLLLHQLEIKDGYNWKNKIETRGPSSLAYVINEQTLRNGLFEHKLHADFNGKEVLATYNYAQSNGETQLSGYLSSPWADPIKMQFTLQHQPGTYKPTMTLDYMEGKRIELEGALVFNVLSGKLQLNLKTPICKPVILEAEYDFTNAKKVGHVLLEWEEKKTNIDIKGDFDVLKASWEMKIVSDQVNEVMNVEGSYDMLSYEKTAQLIGQYQQQKMEVKGSARIESGKYEGNVQIKTPFYNFEELFMSVDVDLTNPTKLAVTTFKRNSDEIRLSGSALVGYNTGKVSLALISPIKNMERLSLVGSYDRSQTNHHLEMSVTLNNVKTELLGKFGHENTVGYLEVSLKTPIYDYEHLGVSAKYDLLGNEKNIAILLQRNDDTIEINMESTMNKFGGDGVLKLKTPLENYRDVSLKLHYETKPEGKTVQLYLQKNDKNIDISGSLSREANMKNVLLEVKTPFEGLEDIKMQGKLVTKANEHSVVFNYARNDKKVELSGLLEKKGFLKAEGAFQIVTPFESYENMDMYFKYDLDTPDKSISCKINTHHGTTELLVAATMSDMKADTKVVLYSPIKNFNRVVVKMGYDFNSIEKVISVNTEHNGVQNNFEAHFTLGQSKVTAEVFTPFTGYERLSLNAECDLESTSKQGVITLHKNNDKYEVTGSVLSQLLHSAIQIDVTTPIEGSEKIHMEGNYDFRNNEKQIMVKVLQNDQLLQVSFSGEFATKISEIKVNIVTPFTGFESISLHGNYDFESDYSGSLRFEKNGEKKSLEGRVALTKDGARVHVITPFEGLEDVSMTGNYENLAQQKSAAVSFERNGKKDDFAVTLNFDKTSLYLQLNTPFEVYEQLTFSGHYDFKGYKKLGSLILSKNDDRIQVSGLFMQNRNAIEVKMDVATPFEDFQELQFHVQYSSTPTMKSMTILSKKNSDKLELTGTLIRKPDTVQIRVSIVSPFENYEKMQSSLDLHLSEQQKTVAFIFEKNSMRKEFSGLIGFDEQALKFEINTPIRRFEHVSFDGRYGDDFVEALVKTPIEGYETISFSGKCSMEDEQKSIRVHLNKNEEATEVEVTVKHVPRYAEITGHIHAPHYDHGKIGIFGKFDLRDSIKTAASKLEIGSETFTLDASLFKDELQMDSVIQITTPLEEYQNIKLHGKYDLQSEEKGANLKLEINNVIKTEVTAKLIYTGMKGKLDIKALTPLTQYKSVDFRCSYNVGEDYKSLDGELRLGDLQYSVTLRHQDLQGQLTFISTVQDYEQININWKLDNGAMQKRADLVIDAGHEQKTELNIVMNQDTWSNVDGKMTFTSPYTDKYDLSVQWSNAKSNKFGSRVVLSYGNNVIDLDGSAQFGRKHATMEIKFRSPFENFEDISFDSKLDYKKEITIETSLQWTRQDRIYLNGFMSLGTLLSNVKVDFITPFTDPFIFTLDYDFSSPEKTIVTVFQYGSQKVQLSGNLQPNNYENPQMRFTLNTPVEGFTYLHLSGRYDFRGNSKQAELSFEKEDEKSEFTFSLQSLHKKGNINVLLVTPYTNLENSLFRATYDYTSGVSAAIDLQWHKNEQVSMSFNWSPMNMKLDISTPFSRYYKLILAYTIQLQDYKKSADIGAELDEKKVELRGQMTGNSNKVDFSLELKSNIIEDFSISGTYDRSLDHEMKVTIQQGLTQNIEINGKLHYTTQDSYLQMDFNSPLSNGKKISFDVGYDLRQATKTAHLIVEYDYIKDEMQVSWVVDNGIIKGDLKLPAMFFEAEKVTVSFEVNVVDAQKFGVLTFMFDDQRIELKGESSYERGHGNAKVSLLSPFTSGTLSSTFSTRYVDVVLDYSGKKYELSGSYEFENKVYSINGTVKTPFNKWKELTLNTYVDLENLIFTLSADWALGKKVYFTSTLRPSDLVLELETPYMNLRNMRLSSQYSYDTFEYGVNTIAQWDTYRMVLYGSLRNDINNYGVKGRINWDDKKVELDAFVRNTGMKSIECTFNLITPYRQFEKMNMHFTFDNNGQAINGNLLLNTPFTVLPQLNSYLSFKYNDKKQMDGKLEATALNKKVSLSASIYNENFKKTQVKINAELPIESLPHLAVDATVDSNSWKNFNADISVTLPSATYKAGGTYVLTENSVDIRVELDTPEVTTHFSAGGSYNFVNIRDVEADVYYNNNKLSGSYKVSAGTFKINAVFVAPDWNIPERSFEILTVLNAGRTVEVSFKYKYPDHAGSVYAMAQRTANRMSTQLDVDLPLLMTEQHIRANVEIQRNKYIFDSSYSGDSFHSAYLLIQNDDDLKLTGKISSDALGQKEFDITLSKTWKLALFHMDNININIRKDDNLASVVIKTENDEHKLHYQLQNTDGYTFKVEIESPFLANRKMSLNGLYKNDASNLLTDVSFQAASKIHHASFNLLNKYNRKDLIVKVDSTHSLTTSIEGSVQFGDVPQAEMIVQFRNAVHKFSAKLQRNPLNGEIVIESPFLQSRRITALLEGENTYNKLRGLVRLATPSSTLQIDGSVHTSSDLTAEFNIITPFEPLTYFKLIANGNMQSGLNADLQVQSSLPSFPEAKMTFDYQITREEFVTHLSIKSPLRSYETIDFSVKIPLRAFNTEPRISLSLPGGEYGMYGSLSKGHKNIALNAAMECKRQKIDFSVLVNYGGPYEMQMEFNTPFRNYEHYELNLRGDMNVRSLGDASVNVEWNRNKIEFSSSVILERDAYTTIVKLTTPFQGYEKYALTLRFEDTLRKTVHAELEYSSQKLGLEFDYFFQNWANMDCKSKINTPFRDLEILSMNVVSQLKSGKYHGLFEGKFNENELAFTANGILGPASLNSKLEMNLNEHEASLNVNCMYSEDKVTAEMEVKSPFETLKNFEAYVLLDRTVRKVTLNTGASYNGDLIFNFVALSSDGSSKIELQNSYQPMSLQYSYSILPSDVNVEGELCWNMNRKQDSQLGIQFTKKSSNRDDFTLKITLPTRVVKIESAVETTESKLENSLALSWEDEKVLGYSLLLEKESTSARTIVRVDFPFRSFEYEGNHKTSNVETSCSANFKWDAINDPTKKFGIQYVVSDLTDWNRKAKRFEYTVIHSALEHNIVISGETSLTGTGQVTAEYQLQYSPYEENHIVLYVSSNNVEKYHVEVGMKHPVSKLDVSTIYEELGDSEQVSRKVTVKYLDQHDQDRMIELFTKVYHRIPQVEVQISTNENSFMLRGSMEDKNDVRIVSVETKMNQKEPLALKFQINSAQPSVEFDANYGMSRNYNVYIGMPHKREITAKAHHTIYGTEKLDSIFSLKLVTNQLLSTRVMWNDDMFLELKQAVLEEYSGVSHVVAAILDSIGEFLTEDMGQKLHQVSMTLEDIVEKMAKNTKAELRKIQNDFKGISRMVRRMYRNNDFYMRDIISYVNTFMMYSEEALSCITQRIMEAVNVIYSVCESFAVSLYQSIPAWSDFVNINFFDDLAQLSQSIKMGIYEVYRYCAEIKEDAVYFYKQVSATLKQVAGNIEKTVMDIVEGIEKQTVAYVKSYVQALEPYYIALEQKLLQIQAQLQALQENIRDFIATMQESVMGIDEVKQLVDFYNNYASWFEEFHLQDYLDYLNTFFSEILQEFVTEFRRLTADYQVYIDATIDAVNGHYEGFMNLPPVAYTNKIFSRVYQKVAWLWQYLEIGEKLKDVFRQFLHDVDEVLMDIVLELDDASINNFDNTLVYRPSEGYLEYTQELPVEWEGFTEMPKFGQLPLYGASQKLKDDMGKVDISKYRYYVMNVFHDYPEDFSLSSLIPPFGTHAMIAGKQHFITFDKKFYEFAGDCSYLLASDFMNKKFSVVVNYEMKDRQVNKKSLTVITDGRRIDIAMNHGVTVDGKKAEMPMELTNTVVKREGDRITITSKYGMELECNLAYDVCTMELSGWFFGKTGGLFGTYDNEQSNDFITPNREIKSIESFANSWKVGSSQCTVKNYASEIPATDSRALEVCNSLFADENSNFHPCFARVDPAPFKSMCLLDLAEYKNSPNENKGACLAAAAYVAECKKSGMDIWMPETCVKCHLMDGTTLNAGEVKVYDNVAIRSSDVVFIVEQKPCLDDINLSDLAFKVDYGLRQVGLEGNRFAVVGFGGDSTFSKPHTQTADGEIWLNKRNIQKAFQSINYNGEGSSSVHDAVWYASRLSFRDGVSKTFVLVLCEDCNESQSYAETMSMLLENDVTMHVLMPKDLKLKGDRKEDESKIFGFDSRGTYSPRNMRNLNPNSNLLRQIVMPKDFCTPLAMETNGTVFNLNKMSPQKYKYVKKFMDVFSRRLALTATPSECQTCDCVPTKDGVGTVLCQRCVSPSIEMFIKEWEAMAANEEDYISLENSTEEELA